jgi:hypothetical protein
MSEQEKTAEILKPFGAFKTPGPSKEVIELLQIWLDKAKIGEITSVALTGCTPHHKTIAQFEAGNDGLALLIASIVLLQDDILSQYR